MDPGYRFSITCLIETVEECDGGLIPNIHKLTNATALEYASGKTFSTKNI